MANSDIIKAANTYMAGTTLTAREVKLPLEASSYSIEVDNQTVPVIPEWTYATGTTLVFNQLSSCLGIIGLHKEDKNQLIGAHFSALFDWTKDTPTILPEIPGAVEAFIKAYKSTYDLYSFGGSQKEWGCSSFAKIARDKNEKKWLFYIDSEAIASQDF